MKFNQPIKTIIGTNHPRWRSVLKNLSFLNKNERVVCKTNNKSNHPFIGLVLPKLRHLNEGEQIIGIYGHT
jgi:hypothetical protein